MAETDVPQFSTNGPRNETPDSNRVPRALWWFIVKDNDLPDEDDPEPKKLCRCRQWTGTTEGITDYIVQYANKPENDDKIYALRANTGRLYKQKLVEWRQESGGAGLFPASGRYKVMQIIDDSVPGTWGADYLRFIESD